MTVFFSVGEDNRKYAGWIGEILSLAVTVHQTLLFFSAVKIYQCGRLSVVDSFITLDLGTEGIDSLVCCSLIDLNCDNEAH